MIQPRDDVIGCAAIFANVLPKPALMSIKKNIPRDSTYPTDSTPENLDNRYVIRLISVPAADNIQREQNCRTTGSSRPTDSNVQLTRLREAGSGWTLVVYTWFMYSGA
ncbi:hypothetical protein J6590_013370 [Homalodisca vitripennis]|nr:hypothetical protein J6590_013370 [Homalodisca vitripennis]